MPLAQRFHLDLFRVSTDVHVHLAQTLDAVQALRTETLERSAKKRVHLFCGQLLSDAFGASIVLAGHDAQRTLFSTARSAYEYVTRALYFSENADKAVEHLRDTWAKEKRLFTGLHAQETIKDNIEANAGKIMADHPEWTRPTDISLQDMLIALYGTDLGRSLYKHHHVLLSGIVHGYFDAMLNVVATVNGGTVMKPGPDVANAIISMMVRITFTMVRLMEREFGVSAGDTPALYHRFCIVRKRVTKLRNPFPMTRKMLTPR
jgi:hypothetical protein